MRTRHRDGDRWPLILLLGLLAVVIANDEARAESISCHVLEETVDGIYLDAGSNQGVRVGVTGIVERQGEEIARVVVASVSRSSSRAEVLSFHGPRPFLPEDRVLLDPERPWLLNPPGTLSWTLRQGNPFQQQSEASSAESSKSDTTASDQATEARPPGPMAREGSAAKSRRPLWPARSRSSTVKTDPASDDEEFVPLLAPPRRLGGGLTPPGNVLVGRIRLRQSWQEDIAVSRIGFDGSLDRLAGSMWSLEWGGDASYRARSAAAGGGARDGLRVDIHRLGLHHRFPHGAFVSLGRLLPRELPAVGYLDGVQGEVALSDGLRVGAMSGFKPDRIDLSPSGLEPMAVVYATTELGTRPAPYFSGTVGLLGSLFQGTADRLAVLLDQRLEVMPGLSISASGQVDFEVGEAPTRAGVELTRLNIYSHWQATSWLAVRGGIDLFKRLDTLAERALLEADSDELFDQGSWRYWLGATQSLPGGFRLTEEVSVTNAAAVDADPSWRLSISRQGLPMLPQARITLTAFRILGSQSEGHGLLLSGYLSFLDGRLSVRPWISAKLMEEGPPEGLSISRVALHADWHVAAHWTFQMGASQSLLPGAESTMLELGLTYRL